MAGSVRSHFSRFSSSMAHELTRYRMSRGSHGLQVRWLDSSFDVRLPLAEESVVLMD